ncbi:hypothetical protein [Singulisphaera sp. PoT]|uniref:hypothetical protein n=1 Tax=Singulisphaera sp. PoT TaxID=3411797 RepID=UPI003BF59DB7
MSAEPSANGHAYGRKVVLKFRPVNRNGRGTLAAFEGDSPLFVDTLDLTKTIDRDRYVSTFAQAHPGVDPAEVAAKLLELVGSLVNAREDGGENKVGFETQAQALIRLAEDVEFFRTADAKLYACLAVEEHREVHQIKSASFRRWLVRAFYLETGGPPSSDAMSAALGVLEAKCEFESPLDVVWTRIAAGSDGSIYLDLCDDAWSAVEIDKSGWRVISNPPVRFRRAKGMGSLPTPKPGGSVDLLRKYVNVADEEDWRLLVAAMAAYLRPGGPFPVLIVNGEQGSAKSTTTRVIRKCIDPNGTLLRCEPREVRDLMIGASNSWVLTLDNLSTVVPWLSDALCRLATGGGYAVRMLYENDEEAFFDAMRPVILNGIGDDVVSRFDLLDRSVILSLPSIPEESRREENLFWADFEDDLPLILGGLLDAVAGGLRILDEVRLEKLPRLADFGRWSEAVGRALGWGEGAAISAYARNRRSSDERAVEGSVVASAICKLVADASFEGNAQELMDRLGDIVGEKVTRSKGWPQSPRGMSSSLARVIPALRKFGIQVVNERAAGGQRKRLIRITNQGQVDEVGPLASISSDDVWSTTSGSNPGAGQGGESTRRPGPVPAVRISEDGRFEEARL